MGGYWQALWADLDRLVESSPLVIDRPRGSRHPRYPEMIYPSDYGYLAGTSAGDGAGVDVWVGSDARRLDALLVSVDLEKRDVEVKLLLGCSPDEAQAILALLNDGSMHVALVHRGAEGLALIQNRRSVRRFRPQPLPAGVLERLLGAAVQAPSAHNRQPWRFVVLETPAARDRLAGALGAEFRAALLADGLPPAEAEAQVSRSYQRLIEAPAAILLCLDPADLDVYPDAPRQQAELLMAVQSVAMAGENLLLAAHAEGLGGVWICAPLFAPAAARAALSLPQDWQPQGLLLLGYPEQQPKARGRKPLQDVVVRL